MKTIGLTGGIASGKSVVAAELAKLGAVVLDADQAAHDVINQPEVRAELVERWGESILQPNGQIDRSQIAQRVFGEGKAAEVELQFLESVLHPRIHQQFEARLQELADARTSVAVIDAPLLLEAGWEGLCDDLVFVDSPRADRLARAKTRNWSEAEFAKREACQMPIAEKRQRSTHILANSVTLASLRTQVQAFWASLAAQQ